MKTEYQQQKKFWKQNGSFNKGLYDKICDAKEHRENDFTVKQKPIPKVMETKYKPGDRVRFLNSSHAILVKGEEVFLQQRVYSATGGATKWLVKNSNETTILTTINEEDFELIVDPVTVDKMIQQLGLLKHNVPRTLMLMPLLLLNLWWLYKYQTTLSVIFFFFLAVYYIVSYRKERLAKKKLKKLYAK